MSGLVDHRAGGIQDWWDTGLVVAGLVGHRALQMLQFRCKKQELRLLLAVHPCPIPSFLLTGPSCFAVNSNSHGPTLKHRTGARKAATGTKTEMNRA